MIISYAYDVEVLPNFFSITFVDITSYLNVFKDCVQIKIKKGKEERIPIPLTQKYTVKEIIMRLDIVTKYSFYVTDKDDSQLLSMLGFINNLRAKVVDGERVVSHAFGYNNNKYDKLMTSCLLMHARHCDNTKALIELLYNTSKKIITCQNNNLIDPQIELLKNYDLPFVNIDVMTIFALNKVGKGTDKNGQTIYFGKSLKQTSINLQWYELLEYNIPPVEEEDYKYYAKSDNYRGYSIEQINKLVDNNVIERWDRYIIDKWIPDMMHYNLNDVFIVAEMIRLYIDEIRLRYNITRTYKVNVLSSSRSNIADKLFTKFYSEFSGLHPKQWTGKTTNRTALSFKRVIHPVVNFKTKELQTMLEEMKKVVIYSTGKDSFEKTFKINNLTYTLATGGLHSQDIPRELKSKTIDKDTNEKDVAPIDSDWSNLTDDSYIYVHWDIASFYPSIMVNYEVAPEHLNKSVFVKLIKWLRDTRVAAKHSKTDLIDGIPKGILAETLKIVINSIYGKLGFEKGNLCDRLAVLKVTINGQLLIIMLCEELELNGIEVMSANTDGIVIKLYKKNKAKFEEISNNWKKLTGFEADSEEYKKYINRDINNYFIEEYNGNLTYKGALNPFMYKVNLDKGYDMPIVAQSVVNYFLYDKPILNSLYEATNILDFCKTQNIGKQFELLYTDNTGSRKIQKNVRFYVSNAGGTLEKVDIDNKKNNLCKGNRVTILNSLDDKAIEFRDINYKYYYNEVLKIINPIKLRISPNAKGDKYIKSGKINIKKYSGQFNTLFDDDEE